MLNIIIAPENHSNINNLCLFRMSLFRAFRGDFGSSPHSINLCSFRMTWFRAFRGDFGNSYYGEFRTSVTTDIPFAAIIYTCILFSIAAIIAAAGIRGREVSDPTSVIYMCICMCMSSVVIFYM